MLLMLHRTKKSEEVTSGRPIAPRPVPGVDCPRVKLQLCHFFANSEVQGLSFVHLHSHSEYSMLDGASRIPKMFSRAKELGMPAVALTDPRVMYAAIPFYLEGRAPGIKPIIGAEADLATQRRFDP